MKWSELAEQPCPIARGLAVVGDRWTLLVLRDCFLGVRRFDEFHSRIGMPRAVLSERLGALMAEAVLEKRGPEYRLTAKGRDLYPVLMALAGWSNRHRLDERGPPLIYRHKACGHEVTPVLACPDCGEPVTAEAMKVRPGKGFPDPRAARLRDAG